MDHARGFGREQRRHLYGVPVDHDRSRDRQKCDSGDQNADIVIGSATRGEDMLEQTFDRRRFVQLVAAASAVAGASLLQACAPSAPSAPAPATAAPSNPMA